MSALHSSLAPLASPNPGLSSGATRRLRVLTVTPFYPSIEDPTQGGFVAEPLSHMERLGITSEVIAAHPFYRGHAHPLNSQIASTWKQYLSFPGNLGLPMAGKFLAAGLMRTIVKWHRMRPFDLIHAHSALPCGQAAALLSRKLGVPFVV